MSDGALDVRCPSCGGLAAVDAEYLDFPEWACPFCGVSNPMPERNGEAPASPAVSPGPMHVSTPWAVTDAELFPILQQTAAVVADPPAAVAPRPVAPQEIIAEPRRRRRLGSGSMAATAIVLIVSVWGLAVQSRKAHGPYQTVDGVGTALGAAGLDCAHLQVSATSDPLVREQAACAIRGETLRIYTFQDVTRRAAYAATVADGFLVSGRMWLVVAGTPRTAFRVATALGGVALPRPARSLAS